MTAREARRAEVIAMSIDQNLTDAQIARLTGLPLRRVEAILEEDAGAGTVATAIAPSVIPQQERRRPGPAPVHDGAEPVTRATCGKPHGRNAHKKAGEDICQACRDAWTEYQREWARNRAAKAAEAAQAPTEPAPAVVPPAMPLSIKAAPVVPPPRTPISPEQRSRVRVRWLVPRGLDETKSRLQYAVGPTAELAGVCSKATAEFEANDPGSTTRVWVRTVTAWEPAQ